MNMRNAYFLLFNITWHNKSKLNQSRKFRINTNILANTYGTIHKSLNIELKQRLLKIINYQTQKLFLFLLFSNR